MQRTTSLLRVLRPAGARFLSTTPKMMSGETGATRAGGDKAGDAFTRREKAAEEMWIKNEERSKLLAIKAKLSEQRKHLDELDKHIDELTKSSGGEQN